jgi:protein involved in polysaccharide export with SLBB domain
MNPIFRLIFLTGILFFSFTDVSAQVNLIQNKDFSGFKSDQLTDADVMKYYQNSAQLGLAESDLFRIFAEKGMPAEEIRKLKERFSALNSAPATSSENRPFRSQEPESDFYSQPEEVDSSIFGSELFSRSSTVFEPNLRIPAPASYQLGPDDELLVNVFGLSEKSYQLTVSNEGQIYIPNVGPLNISGMTIEKATALIKNRLSSTIYSSLSSGKTELQVSLGKIKSIRVTVIGQAKRTGTYTVSSLSTLYNLLFICGGPGKSGSYRNIELIRGNKIFKSVDLYQFLMSGDQSQNILLQEGDIVRLPYAANMVNVVGNTKRQGKFEMKASETISDLLNYCGGFNNSAYQKSVGLSSLVETGRLMRDIPESDFNKQGFKSGDELFVNSIRDIYLNRVCIFGSVKRPGYYELSKGMQMRELLERAGGLMPEAYGRSASVYRKMENKIPEMLSVNIDSVVNNGLSVALKNEDSIHINSILDFREALFVTIDGYVQKPSAVIWRENLSLFDLITEAGGISEAGDSGRIEVSRKVNNADVTKTNHAERENIVTDLKSNLLLKPYDIIIVRNKSYNIEQRVVLLAGELRYPGKYVLQKSGERLTDLLNRAGGFKSSADSNFITIRRKLISNLTKGERERMFQRLLDINQDSLNSNNRLRSELLRDYELVSVNMDNLGKNYNSPDNLILEDGDIVTIEKFSNLVKISGEVLFPTVITRLKNRAAKYYLRRAGGYTTAAEKKGLMVIYPNGKAKTVKRILFLKKYPRVTPRSEIFVPQKENKQGNKLTTSELAIIVTSMGILANIFIAVFK